MREGGIGRLYGLFVAARGVVRDGRVGRAEVGNLGGYWGDLGCLGEPRDGRVGGALGEARGWIG